MAFISRAEFLKNQAERQSSNQQSNNNVGFLKIPEGGEAIVRFCYSNPDDLDIITYHLVAEPGKPEYQGKRYDCKRKGFSDPISNCPLCKSGLPLKQKLFIKLIEYTKDEQGNIKPEAKIWERSTSWVNKISSLFEEYGDISDCVFKIKRTGSGLETRYSDPMLANPTIYNADLYKKDFSAFDNYKIIGGLVATEFEEDKDVQTVSQDQPKPRLPREESETLTNTTPRKVVY